VSAEDLHYEQTESADVKPGMRCRSVPTRVRGFQGISGSLSKVNDLHVSVRCDR